MHTLITACHDQQPAPDGCKGMPARPTYFLSEHSYCCEFEDGAIILELDTGTYLGVHAECLHDLRACVRNWPHPQQIDRGLMDSTSAASEHLIAELLSRGILTTSPTPKRSLTTTTPLAALTITDSAALRERVPIKHIRQFAMAILIVATRHRDKTLPSLLGWLRQRQGSIRNGHSVTSSDAARLLASFLRLRIWFYTADQRCLFDSLVLAVFLTRQWVPCTFVIGVSTKPFRAHSWLQIRELVLNDTAEHVQTFTPILAIGESS
jgi:Transglutaminase-like superfamily